MLAALTFAGEASHAIGPFIVWFDFDGATLDERDKALLDQAAEAYRQLGSTGLALHGHSDTAGPASHNETLSRRRAEAVRDYLHGRGIPLAAMRVDARGERFPLVETGDDVAEAENRRVELLFL
ncbi:MAG TPA: OmpA family protein [Allosphingosinicella sp.]|jgi:outer membrane protein OmpA-like peptidoglycan-associated protein